MVAIFKRPILDPMQALTDEFVSLHKEVKAFEAKAKRYEQLKKQLAEYANDLSDDEEVKITGQFGYAVFSKPAMTRHIPDNQKALQVLGVDLFVACSSLSVMAVSKVTTLREQSDLFETSIGSRRLKDAGTMVDLLRRGLAS